MPTATVSLHITPTDDSSHTADQSLSFSSPVSASTCPSEHTLSHSSAVTVPASQNPVTSSTASSPSFTPLNLSPLTPRTLRSHPNFKEETLVHMRSLT